MPTSVYFNNQDATREQFLVEDLILESIKNHGIDVIYLPRASQSTIDELFGDDTVKYFNESYTIDVYMETFNDFEGNQEFFSKFGLEIQKNAKIAVARRTFSRFIPNATRNSPKEGDLIWLPVQQKLMEIKRVEEEKNFFQAGKIAPYMFGLTIETFKYNGELFDTGIFEIDEIQNRQSYAINFTVAAGGVGNFEIGEPVYQGNSYSAASIKAYVADFDKATRILRLRNIKGTFVANQHIKGFNSSASWIMQSGNIMNNQNDADDNIIVENEADNILDWTETNPFGSSDET